MTFSALLGFIALATFFLNNLIEMSMLMMRRRRRRKRALNLQSVIISDSFQNLSDGKLNHLFQKIPRFFKDLLRKTEIQYKLVPNTIVLAICWVFLRFIRLRNLLTIAIDIQNGIFHNKHFWIKEDF